MLNRNFLWLSLCCLITLGCSGPDPSTTSDDTAPPLPAATGTHQVPAFPELGPAAADDRDNVETIVPIRFKALGPESGLDFVRFDDFAGQHRLLEANGGGVAVLDVDADSLPDIFFSNGCRIPIAADDRRTPGSLFRNIDGTSFRNISTASGLIQTGLGFGCAVADIDNDGFQDLCVTRYGSNQIWLNLGDGTFVESAAEMGLTDTSWGSSAAFADLNGDGNTDLYIVNYVRESDVTPRLCPEPASPDGYIGCSPALFDAAADCLYLSDGQGRFIDASRSSGLDQHPGKGLGVVICDLDGDNQQEIYVANDGQANTLFRVHTSPTIEQQVAAVKLTEQAFSANLALNELGYAQAGMGVTAADFDRNGMTDLFLTHFFGDTNTLYENHSQPGHLLFRDGTRRSGLGPPSRDKLGFGTVAADFNLDGWCDLMTANGHVDDRTWLQDGQPFRMNAQVFANRQGRFEEVSSDAGEWFSEPQLGRGLAAADFNRDGKIDAVVSSQLQQATVLLNQSPALNSAVRIRFCGRESSRIPAGLTLEVLSDPDGHQMSAAQTLVAGGSYQSASEQLLTIPMITSNEHNGMIRLRVTWPSGSVISDILHNGFWVWPEGRTPLQVSH